MLQLHAAFGAAPAKQPPAEGLDAQQQLAAFERTGDGAPVVWFDLGEADAGAVGLQLATPNWLVSLQKSKVITITVFLLQFRSQALLHSDLILVWSESMHDFTKNVEMC